MTSTWICTALPSGTSYTSARSIIPRRGIPPTMVETDRDDTSYNSMGPDEQREGATILNPFRTAALSALDEASLT